MRYFITLLILFSCLDGYSQKVAVRLNALPATDGAFGAGVSYGIGNKSTVELAGSLRPWKRSEMYVNRYWLIQPEYKYWTCQKFNGFFWGGYLNGAQFRIDTFGMYLFMSVSKSGSLTRLPDKEVCTFSLSI